MFTSSGVELPLPTKILLGLSSFLSGYWWQAVIGLILITFGIRYFLKTEKGAYGFDYLKLRMPVFKDIILKSSIARFSHILKTLIMSGIQIIKALEITEITLDNRVLSQDIRRAKKEVIEGVPLSAALGKSQYFPKMTIKMMAIGEQSGALDKMLDNIARQYDEAVDSKIEGLSSLVEPMMTVVIGIFLLIFAMGIFLPMWDMNTLMK